MVGSRGLAVDAKRDGIMIDGDGDSGDA